MNTPKNLGDKYIAFFHNDEAGRWYVEQLQSRLDENTRTARKENSLDYLSRSKGNEEALDLIENVINVREARKE